MYPILKRNNVHVIENSTATETLVFAHGFGSEQSAWRFVTPAFLEKYRIVLFDWMGCGASDLSQYDPQHYSSMQAYASDLIQICDTLRLKRVRLIAHSVSCILGTLVSLQRPEIFSDMVMIGGSPCFLNDQEYHGGFDQSTINAMLDAMTQNYVSWAEGFSPAAINRPDLPHLTHEFFMSLSSARPDVSINFAKLIFLGDYRQVISKLNIPAFILQMQNDIFVPEQVGVYLHNVIQNSEYHQLSAVGHFPHLSATQELITVIADYFNRHPIE